MKSGPAVLLSFVGSMLLMGCSPRTILQTASPATPLDLSGNWQIQSANTTPSATNNVLLFGALSSQGAKVAGTFRFADLAPGNSCGALNQVITVTGVLDTSHPLTQTLTLTSATFAGSVLTAQLTLSTVLPGTGTGTIQITGPNCTFASSQALAVEFPAVTGTYSGTLTPISTVPNNVSVPGTATLTMTQATTPNPDGQFSVTGAIKLTSGTCTSITNLSGTTSGTGVTLVSSINPLTATSFVTFAATNTPLTAQIVTPQLQAADVLYYPAPCSSSLSTTAEYSGTLTKQ
jgi:hypothetical protein